MTTFFLTLLLFGVLMAIMAIGVVFSGRELKGSCGGTPGGDCTCTTTKRKACERRAAAAGIIPDDGHHHLDVLSDEAR